MFAEASCASIVRSARNFVEDIGAQVASRSTGLVELSQRLEKNAERDCNRLLVGRYKLALPVRVTDFKTDGDMTVPVLKLRHWFEYLIGANHTHILTGLKEPDWEREACILKAFWARYRVQCPDHPVFSREREGLLDLSTCYPLIFHGDEGRGRKRAAFLVMNFHSLLGQGVQENKKKRKGKKEPYEKMDCNFHGHTLTTRFLLTALPKHFYTGEREFVFQSLLDLAATEAEHMFYSGVVDSKTGRGIFTAALLAISGDWPFLADSGGLLRSFRNVQKRKTRKSLPNGVCHLCAAGTIGWDFEQINTKKPRWLQSMHDPNLPLFAEGAESPFCRVPHPPQKTGALWAYDIFHTFHLGVARCFLGSCIVLLSELENEGAVDDRFSSLSSGYVAWCKSRKKRCFITKLTKEHIQWPTTSSYPSGGWHKGGLSTVLMEWMQDRYEREGASWNGMLVTAGEASVCANRFFRILYNGEAWLAPAKATEAGELCLDFLKKYASLASTALASGRQLWILQPKHHALHHIGLDLLQGGSRGFTLNPLCVSAQQDEDYIGRPSRLARRVTAQQPVAHRVISRLMQATYSQYVKAGYIKTSVRSTSSQR